MSSPQSSSADGSFQDRLAKVRQRQEPAFAARPAVEVLPDWRENISGPAGYALAFLTGCLAVFLVRLLRFHIMGTAITGPNPDLVLGIETFGAMTVSFLIFMLLPWKGYQYKLVQFSGVALIIATMHNAVHSTPTLFGLMFSQEWTEEILAETVPNSVYVRGQSIPFSGKLPEAETQEVAAADVAPVKPKVKKLGQESSEKPALPRRIKIGE